MISVLLELCRVVSSHIHAKSIVSTMYVDACKMFSYNFISTDSTHS
jgi:hypothetical protein